MRSRNFMKADHPALIEVALLLLGHRFDHLRSRASCYGHDLVKYRDCHREGKAREALSLVPASDMAYPGAPCAGWG
jgi:hypothetical protein